MNNLFWQGPAVADHVTKIYEGSCTSAAPWSSSSYLHYHTGTSYYATFVRVRHYRQGNILSSSRWVLCSSQTGHYNSCSVINMNSKVIISHTVIEVCIFSFFLSFFLSLFLSFVLSCLLACTYYVCRYLCAYIMYVCICLCKGCCWTSLCWTITPWYSN